MNIYLINVSEVTTEELEHHKSLLWETRQNRLSRIKNESDRRRCIMAGALLQYAWQQEHPWMHEHLQACVPEIGYQENGKPFFLNSDWHFSLSHSGDYAACALCYGEPVGVDIQKITEFRQGFAERFFTERERHWAAGCGSEQEKAKRCTMIWCMKESLLKRDGSGLRRELNTLDTDGTEVRLCAAPEGYALAVCGKEETDTVVICKKI